MRPWGPPPRPITRRPALREGGPRAGPGRRGPARGLGPPGRARGPGPPRRGQPGGARDPRGGHVGPVRGHGARRSRPTVRAHGAALAARGRAARRGVPGHERTRGPRGGHRGRVLPRRGRRGLRPHPGARRERLRAPCAGPRALRLVHPPGRGGGGGEPLAPGHPGAERAGGHPGRAAAAPACHGRGRGARGGGRCGCPLGRAQRETSLGCARRGRARARLGSLRRLRRAPRGRRRLAMSGRAGPRRAPGELLGGPPHPRPGCARGPQVGGQVGSRSNDSASARAPRMVLRRPARWGGRVHGRRWLPLRRGGPRGADDRRHVQPRHGGHKPSQGRPLVRARRHAAWTELCRPLRRRTSRRGGSQQQWRGSCGSAGTVRLLGLPAAGGCGRQHLRRHFPRRGVVRARASALGARCGCRGGRCAERGEQERGGGLAAPRGGGRHAGGVPQRGGCHERGGRRRSPHKGSPAGARPRARAAGRCALRGARGPEARGRRRGALRPGAGLARGAGAAGPEAPGRVLGAPPGAHGARARPQARRGPGGEPHRPGLHGRGARCGPMAGAGRGPAPRAGSGGGRDAPPAPVRCLLGGGRRGARAPVPAQGAVRRVRQAGAVHHGPLPSVPPAVRASPARVRLRRAWGQVAPRVRLAAAGPRAWSSGQRRVILPASLALSPCIVIDIPAPVPSKRQ
mmetsp:Transcript_20393/g.68445  ORF Transcript_20393/g.68445 Transcript_20393/m.68445 type:complete len:686 (+) Transcript_20393:743-2800(+)